MPIRIIDIYRQTETVAWVSQRSGILSLFFMLLAWHAWEWLSIDFSSVPRADFYREIPFFRMFWGKLLDYEFVAAVTRCD